MTDCNKCKYSYEEHCDNCYECEMFDNDLLICKCTTIAIDADCPYFVEYEDEE